MNRLYIIISTILFLILFAYSSHIVQAEPQVNVLDCLENEEDCLEIENEEKSEQTELEESELLGKNEFQPGSTIINVLKMIFALLLVLVLIYVVIKLLSRRQKLNHHGKSLENMGGISVGHQKSVQVIRVGQRFYLIGVGENVDLLQEITDVELIDDLLHQQNETDEPINTLLSSFLQKKNKSENTDDFKDQFKQELSKIKRHRKTLINKHTEKEDEHD